MYKNYINKPDILNRYVYKILLIMRLTTVILIISMLQVSASTLAQKFTYVKKQIPLFQVFKEVKKQTGYNILWNERSMNANQLIDANFRKSSIQEVLNQCIGQLPLSFSIDGKMVFIKQKENEPSLVDKVMDLFKLIDVRGKVVDEKNEPLVGAVVRIKGTKIATSTNSKGEFTLANVDDKAVLVISFLGYEPQEITVTEKMGEVRLVMSIDGLKEVEINAGYYTVTDRERTGSISRITAMEIEKQPVNNILMALVGKIPGIQITQTTGIPGGGFKVQIRGQNSIRSGNNPLYIIDGVIYPSSRISGITTSALFLNSDGASPMSLINPGDIESIEILKDADATSIYGSRGANGVILITTKRGKKGDTKVNIGLSHGFNEVAHFMDLLNTEQYLQMRREAYFTNDKLLVTAPEYATQYDINGIWDENKYTDWQKELIGRKPKTSNITMNVNGGTENSNYTISGNYYSEGTVFPGDFGLSRLGVRSNVNLGSITDRFNVSFTATLNHTETKLSAGNIAANILLPPNAPDIYDEYGQLNWGKNTVFTNPIALTLQTSNAKTDNLIGDLVVSYQILQNLTLKSSFGYSTIKRQEFQKFPLASYSPVENPLIAKRVSNFGNNYVNNWIAEPLITYKTVIGKNVFNGLVGMSLQGNNSQLNIINARDFTSDDLMENVGSASTVTSTSDFSEYRYLGVFARLNYQLSDTYFFNLTARRDGSSKFGPGKQFANFGAIGASWIFSNEKAINRFLPFISFGKLRASYGITGNDQISNYAYLQLWNASNPYQGATLSPVSLAPNADFAWEKNKKLEIALQLGFLEGKVNTEASFYRNQSSNQLLSRSLPLSTGLTSFYGNLPGKIKNIGWEFNIDANLMKVRNFAWSTNFNITLSKNTLLAYPGLESSADAINYQIGKPLNIIKLYNVIVNKETGIYELEDYNNNGNGASADNGDRYIIKSLDPKYYGGFQNSLNYKQFSLDFSFSFTKQNGRSYRSLSVYNPGRWTSGGNSNQLTEVLNRWQQVNDETQTQKYSTTSANNLINSRVSNSGNLSVVDASYIRMRNLSLAYSLPKPLLSTLRMANASIIFQAQNLFTFTNYVGLDPETQSLTVPPLRTFMFGFNVTF